MEWNWGERLFWGGGREGKAPCVFREHQPREAGWFFGGGGDFWVVVDLRRAIARCIPLFEHRPRHLFC